MIIALAYIYLPRGIFYFATLYGNLPAAKPIGFIVLIEDIEPDESTYNGGKIGNNYESVDGSIVRGFAHVHLL